MKKAQDQIRSIVCANLSQIFLVGQEVNSKSDKVLQRNSSLDFSTSVEMTKDLCHLGCEFAGHPECKRGSVI